VVVVSFALTRLLPGDPAVFRGRGADAEAIADLRRTLLLDRHISAVRRLSATCCTAISAARW
jgi:hypothetical protein